MSDTILQSLNELDFDLLSMMARNGSEFLDSFFTLATDRLPWLGLYIGVYLYSTLRFGWRKGLLILLAALLTLTLADWVNHNLIRKSLCRMRPCNPDNPHSLLLPVIEGFCPGAYGFPSNHDVNTFSVATVLSRLIKSKFVTATLFTWACLNCYTRIWYCLHYPGDILAGMVEGVLLGLLMALLFSWLMRRYPVIASGKALSVSPATNWIVPGSFLLTLASFAILSL